jgi:periplasmic protein TonB
MKRILILFLFLFSFSAFAQVNQQVTVDREASYPGGDEAMVSYIWQNLKPTVQSKGQVIVGEIMVSVDVPPDGKPENFVFLEKIGMGLDEQVQELLAKQTFVPSIQNGTAVKMNIVLTIPIRARH